MQNPFKTNPEKASSKIRINNNLIAVCLTLFGIVWAFAPERLDVEIVMQFIFAVPLLYLSSIAYTKIAYWKEVRLWDYLGWFSGTTGMAFVLNIVGIFTYLLGYEVMMIVYYLVIWGLLLLYTIINIHYDKKVIGIKVFKLAYFILIQLFFGLGVLYL